MNLTKQNLVYNPETHVYKEMWTRMFKAVFIEKDKEKNSQNIYKCALTEGRINSCVLSRIL